MIRVALTRLPAASEVVIPDFHHLLTLVFEDPAHLGLLLPVEAQLRR